VEQVRATYRSHSPTEARDAHHRRPDDERGGTSKGRSSSEEEIGEGEAELRCHDCLRTDNLQPCAGNSDSPCKADPSHVP
jgi:hypothetical protein